MELRDVEAGDTEIREAFHTSTKRLIDHLINQNRMSNQSFLDRLRNELNSCQRYGFDYYEQRMNAAAMKPLTADEEKEVRLEVKAQLKELIASTKLAKAAKKAGLSKEETVKLFGAMEAEEEGGEAVDHNP